MEPYLYKYNDGSVIDYELALSLMCFITTANLRTDESAVILKKQIRKTSLVPITIYILNF